MLKAQSAGRRDRLRAGLACSPSFRAGSAISPVRPCAGGARLRPVDTTSYDLIAIGSGPAGQRAAIQAARLGKRAAIVERQGQAKSVYGSTRGLKRKITIDDLLWRTQQVVEHEQNAIHDQLRRNSVDILVGTASFLDPHTIEIVR